MLIYYRLPGFAAALALIVFIFLNIAVFKLLPVTLTLPAITGFLISIGTAVDGNILIFERIKEELRAGLPLDNALKAGFDRAWTSILRFQPVHHHHLRHSLYVRADARREHRGWLRRNAGDWAGAESIHCRHRNAHLLVYAGERFPQPAKK